MKLIKKFVKKFVIDFSCKYYRSSCMFTTEGARGGVAGVSYTVTSLNTEISSNWTISCHPQEKLE